MAVADVTRVSVASYKLTVTGLLASTCPVSVPAVGTGVEVEVDVEVGVGDSTGVAVNVAVGDPVGVGDSTGVDVNVGVGDSTSVGVNVGVDVLPTMVRLVPVEDRLVSTLSPLDARTVHSIAL